MAELRAVPSGVRESLLLVATALAAVDEEVSAIERAALERLATTLEVPAQRAEELAQWATEFVVEQLFDALYADGVMNAEEAKRIEQAATRLAVSPATLTRLDARARSRRGVA